MKKKCLSMSMFESWCVQTLEEKEIKTWQRLNNNGGNECSIIFQSCKNKSHRFSMTKLHAHNTILLEKKPLVKKIQNQTFELPNPHSQYFCKAQKQTNGV